MLFETPEQKRARLLRAWNPSRRRRLERRLEYHRKRALAMGCKAEVLNINDVIENYLLFDNKCSYCQSQNHKVQIDHIKALSRGGSHTVGNIAPACRKCNRSKNASSVKEWYRKQVFFANDRWKILLLVLKKDKFPTKKKQIRSV